MQFALTDEQRMIREAARKFFAARIDSTHLHAVIDGAADGVDLWHAAAGEMGLAGLVVPEQHGGAGLGMVELAIVAEAAGYHAAPLPLLAGVAMAAPALLAGGTDAQKAMWLPRLASGAVRGSVALTGPDGDIERAGVTRSGDRLTGAAHFVPDGAGAELFIVAVADGAMALVLRTAPGGTVERCVSLDMTRPHAVLRLDDVVAEPLADAAAARAAALQGGWIALAADALGGAQACIERTVAYAKERVQFGRRIGSYQAVKHRLADMMVEIEQARSAVYWAACAADEGSADAPFAAHAAKAFATDAYASCAGNMIQLHGGIGFTWEHDAHIFFKRARADQALLGSPAWHRERIARLAGLDEAA